LSVRS
jgi:hypothetical protein